MSSSPVPTIRTRALTLRRLGFVAIAAAGIAVFATYVKFEAQARWQRAAESISAEAGERTAKVQEWLLRMDRTLDWFRAEDVSTSDRIAVTVRMLHTERFVAPARTLFLVSSTGRLIAGTLPLPDGASMQPWFKSIQGRPARNGLQLTSCTVDPFGTESGVVMYHAVLDRDVVAGYVGTFLPQAAIVDMTQDRDPTNGTIGVTLRTATGEVFGCGRASTSPPSVQQPGVFRAIVGRLIHASPSLSQRTIVGDDRTIAPGELHLIAVSDALDTMSDDDWTALGIRAGYVAVSLLLIMALAASLLNRLSRRVRPGLLPNGGNAATDGADWMWELDNLGQLVGLAGNAPDHLLPPSGRSLAEIAGPISSNDMRWDRLTAAICAKHAFEGLQVPFQIPGRTGLLTIFEFSGQPVLASGGFWGTASLVSEESVAQPASPPLPKVQLSHA